VDRIPPDHFEPDGAHVGQSGLLVFPLVGLLDTSRTAFCDGIQRPSDLAELFDVSARAIEVRLSQLGLTGPLDDATRPAPRYRLQPRTRRYYRPRSLNWALATEEVAA
jgi:hypothetical protein